MRAYTILVNLQRNKLGGSIPTELAQLDDLVMIKLETNDLTGVIPNVSALQDVVELAL